MIYLCTGTHIPGLLGGEAADIYYAHAKQRRDGTARAAPDEGARSQPGDGGRPSPPGDAALCASSRHPE